MNDKIIEICNLANIMLAVICFNEFHQYTINYSQMYDNVSLQEFFINNILVFSIFSTMCCQVLEILGILDFNDLKAQIFCYYICFIVYDKNKILTLVLTKLQQEIYDIVNITLKKQNRYDIFTINNLINLILVLLYLIIPYDFFITFFYLLTFNFTIQSLCNFNMIHFIQLYKIYQFYPQLSCQSLACHLSSNILIEFFQVFRISENILTTSKLDYFIIKIFQQDTQISQLINEEQTRILKLYNEAQEANKQFEDLINSKFYCKQQFFLQKQKLGRKLFNILIQTDLKKQFILKLYNSINQAFSLDLTLYHHSIPIVQQKIKRISSYELAASLIQRKQSKIKDVLVEYFEFDFLNEDALKYFWFIHSFIQDLDSTLQISLEKPLLQAKIYKLFDKSTIIDKKQIKFIQIGQTNAFITPQLYKNYVCIRFIGTTIETFIADVYQKNQLEDQLLDTITDISLKKLIQHDYNQIHSEQLNLFLDILLKLEIIVVYNTNVCQIYIPQRKKPEIRSFIYNCKLKSHIIDSNNQVLIYKFFIRHQNPFSNTYVEFYENNVCINNDKIQIKEIKYLSILSLLKCYSNYINLI